MGTLFFADKKERGRLPVLDESEVLVASIDTAWLMGRSFTAYDAHDAVLCQGAGRFVSRGYDVTDGTGGRLFTVKTDFWSSHKRAVQMADGTSLVLRGSRWLGRDWAVEDAAGTVLLRIVPNAGLWSLRIDSYAVEVLEPALPLAVVVGLVQANRTLVKARRNSGAVGV